MCRHLAHVGPPVTLASPVLDAPHSLLHQDPADMRGGGTVNVDGFGWYPGPGAALRYRTASPIWSDDSFAALARVTTGTALLATVRSATTGMPVTPTADAPFADGRWLFSHNGRVAGRPDTITGPAGGPAGARSAHPRRAHRLRTALCPSPPAPAGREEPGAAVAGAVAPGSRLNLLLTDGTTIWATAWDHALSLRVAADHALVASEPIDPEMVEHNAPWTEVPDRYLVVARPGHHTMHPLLKTTGVR